MEDVLTAMAVGTRQISSYRVHARTRELALIAGRATQDVSQADYEQAKREARHELNLAPVLFARSEPTAGFDASRPQLNPTERAWRAEILRRSYSIWQRNGCPANTQVADWLEAEAEVLSVDWPAEKFWSASASPRPTTA